MEDNINFINQKTIIEEGKTSLGIEFGSTKIKAVLIDFSGNVMALGDYMWENKYEDGFWTYSIEDIKFGLKAAYKELKADVMNKYNITLKKITSFGVSAMMHGYMAFDKDDNLLVPFRTWRNTTTGEARDVLSKCFNFNIPQRWSIAHLYQAILNKESHVKDISYITTLAGYVHYLLTGYKVLGIGDASGMFPVDSETLDYKSDYIDKFEELIKDYDFGWKLRDILPEVKIAGDRAGVLTEEGVSLLDESKTLISGALAAPPEGDAGTGMVATNSVTPRFGNVSAGTSVFAMIVLDKPLKERHDEIDVVTTPDGKDVAMVHCNNCTSDINAWADMLSGFAKASGSDMTMNDIYDTMFKNILEGDDDCGGVISYNYFSGEHVTGLESGAPLLLRKTNASFTFKNLMRSLAYSAVATLKLGMDILFDKENVAIDKMYGHGGFFKNSNAGQTVMASALNCPVSVMETAGEGGPYGMACLALYTFKKKEDENLDLKGFLENLFFSNAKEYSLSADESIKVGFESFIADYKNYFDVERKAAEINKNN